MGKHSHPRAEKPVGSSVFSSSAEATSFWLNPGRTSANRRPFTRTMGAAAGGLLGVAFIPVAVAFADDYDYVPVAGSKETVTGLFGLEITSPPDEAGSVQGYQEFEVYDTTTQQGVGTFYADEANVTGDTLGETNQELLVIPNPTDPATTGTVGIAAGDTPPVGSVIDTYSDSGFGYIYSDLASTTGGANTIAETLVTPFGDSTIPTTFDAVAGLASDSSNPALQDITLTSGYEIVPATSETTTAISGLPPYDVALEGTQLYNVVDTVNGDVVGTFDADVASTTDAVGFSTQALLVTSDVSGTAGTAVGNVPAVGSVFNTIDYNDAGTPIYTDVYSDLTSATPGGADDITNTDTTPFGDFSVPTTFDAATTESSPAFALGDGYTIDAAPGSTEVFTGVNGLPPYDVAVQGTQEFDVDNAAGTSVGTFDADVANSSTSQGVTEETLLVTSDDGYTNVGTAAGDVPAVGSVFDTYTYGYSGFETIYSDLTSATPGGPDTITEILVTPFGDFTLPNTLDAAAGLAVNLLADPAAAVDPSAALDTGALADLFPNIDAALNALASLF